MDAAPLLRLAARLLAKHKLDAVLIGNAAAALNGAPVTTIDLDFMIRATPTNTRKVKRLAEDLGAELVQPFYPASKLWRLTRARDQLQFDFMTQVSGIRSFEGLRSRSTTVEFGGNPLRVAALEDVIRSKEAANRLEDRAVLPILRQVVRERDRLYAADRRRQRGA